MNNLFERFLQEKEYLENRTPNTIHYFKQCWKSFRSIIPDGFSQELLEKYIIEKRKAGMTAGCLNSYIKGLNSFGLWLQAAGLTDKLIRAKLLKTEKKVMRSFTDKELSRLINYRPKTCGQHRTKTLLLALLDTGCRIDELLTLTRSDVSFDQLHIKVMGKGRKERILPISIELRKHLYKFLQTHPHTLVFCTREGNKLNYQNTWRDAHDLFKKIGVEPEGFHAMRRTFARSYLKNGGNLIYLQALLGHERLDTTRGYIEVEQEDLQRTHVKTSILSRLK